MTYGYWPAFFYFAALFNLAVGAPLVMAPEMGARAMGLPTPDVVFLLPFRLLGLCIVMLGATYLLVARDPGRYRVLVVLGIVGKLGVVALTLMTLLTTGVPQSSVTAAGGDLLFILAFTAFLLRRPQRVAR